VGVRAWLAVLAVLAGIGFSSAAASNSALLSDPQWKQARKDLARGNSTEAKAEFESLLDRYPNEADLQLFLGMTLLRLRDPRGAEVAARKAIALNPHMSTRGLFWHGSSWKCAAMSMLRSMNIKRSSSCTRSCRTLTAIWVAQKRKGELDRALANLNRALALKPAFASALTTRGGIFGGTGQVGLRHGATSKRR